MARPTAAPVLLAVVSDLHCGGTTALCPPEIRLDDGGRYTASPTQRWLWANWLDYWQQVKREVAAVPGTRLYVIFNGDMVDGAHHGTTQILSGNPNAQAAAVNAAVAVPLALKPSRLFFVRGTEAHVGHSACAEERIADGLRRDKRPVVGDPETGNASWWHLKLTVHRTLVDVTHHGRTGQREHTRGSAAVLHAHDILLAHVKRGERYPDLCLRGHHHKFNDSHDAAPVRVVTGGAWQLGTAYVHKVAPDSLADIGGLLVTITPDAYTVRRVHYPPLPSPTWHEPKP